MFYNTKIDNIAQLSAINIDKFHFDASKSENSKRLSNELSLKESYIMLYNSWFLIDDKLYYYKDTSIFKELFLSELIKYFNLISLEYKYAYLSGNIGIISESFKKTNYEYFDYDHYFQSKNLNVPRTLVELNDIFDKILSKENKQTLMNEFFRLTVFDWFSGQSDRGDANLIFKISSDTRLAPIFDNGASMSYHKKIKENILILLSSYFSSFDNLRFPIDNIYLNEDNFYLFKLITDNNEFFKYFSLALDIDITYFINETIKKYHLIIPSEDKKEIIEFFDYKKQIIENTLKLSIKYK